MTWNFASFPNCYKLSFENEQKHTLPMHAIYLQTMRCFELYERFSWLREGKELYQPPEQL